MDGIEFFVGVGSKPTPAILGRGQAVVRKTLGTTLNLGQVWNLPLHGNLCYWVKPEYNPVIQYNFTEIYPC